jgi:hypothetical protein
MHYTANGDFLGNKETFTNIKRSNVESFQGSVSTEPSLQSEQPPVQSTQQAPVQSTQPPVVVPPSSTPAVSNNQIDSSFTQGGVTYIVGKQGPKGDQGPVGPVGPKGDQGSKGDEGNVGPAGPKGDQGQQGVKGDQGNLGPAGPAGPAGPTGPAGPKGDPGNPGADGKDFDPTPYKKDICTFFNALANTDVMKNSDIAPPSFCLNVPSTTANTGASVAAPVQTTTTQATTSQAATSQATTSQAAISSQGFANVYRESFNNVNGNDMYNMYNNARF